jgi:DNA-binding MarR family transcriptional regulator
MSSGMVKAARGDTRLATTLRVSVMRLSRRLRNERDVDDDLSATQLGVLGTLHRRGMMTTGELAAAERVQPPSMTRTVNGLCERGLVRRAAHESDGRVVMLTLTEEAETLLAEARRRKDEWLSRQLRLLTTAERQILRDAAPVLERLSQA